MDDRFMVDRIRPEPPVFVKVSDRDLVTLADVLCRSLEFHSMLVASKVMGEVGARDLWPAVIERRAHSLRLSAPGADEDDMYRIAAEQIQCFRDDHFPVEPEYGDDPTEAARRWNGCIAF
ncbi:hypothetical protein [Cryobacterium sp. M25]|uniref:hypothetical protein n=2 Tax=unclassified Cryobacterium TaxID=2649013 RepID=UPI001304FC28|nr:hypothetical protein [Cryobacterium sp. M25]